jgi:hypothetical protein
VAFNFDYDNRYVVFLDILGFKDMIAKIDINQALFELLIELPQIVAQNLDMANRTFGSAVDAQSTAFSDSIVISASASAPMTALYTVVNTTVTLCQKLLHRRAVARGGLAKGPCYHRNNVVFGQGMIDAYLLEQSAAKMPRVVVAPDIAKDWLDAFSRPGGLVALRDLITRDTDDVDYIDMFHFPEHDSIDNTTLAFFKESGPNIRAMLDEPGIGNREREKILWVASKYNAAGLLKRLRLPRINTLS